jgi:hypothetical protein
MAPSSSLHAEFSEVASLSPSLYTTFRITCTLMLYREMHKSRAPEFCSVAQCLWILSMEPASFHFSGAWKNFGPLVCRMEFEVLTLVTMKNCVCVVGWIRTEFHWVSILTIRRHLT